MLFLIRMGRGSKRLTKSIGYATFLIWPLAEWIVGAVLSRGYFNNRIVSRTKSCFSHDIGPITLWYPNIRLTKKERKNRRSWSRSSQSCWTFSDGYRNAPHSTEAVMIRYPFPIPPSPNHYSFSWVKGIPRRLTNCTNWRMDIYHLVQSCVQSNGLRNRDENLVSLLDRHIVFTIQWGDRASENRNGD